ncbi:MAG: Pullulanase [Opitutia bacterium UBA7350]|nr:MAG: Pullulanase [Opitutae bacterium UBA7350]
MSKDTKQLEAAFWEDERYALVFLGADLDPLAENPPLSLGPGGTPFASIELLAPVKAARYTRYYRDGDNWVFRLQAERYPQLQDSTLKIYLGADFNGWDAAIGLKQWQLNPYQIEDTLIYELKVDAEAIPKNSPSAFKFATESGEWLDVPEGAPNLTLTKGGIPNFKLSPSQSGAHVCRCQLPKSYQPMGAESIMWQDATSYTSIELPHTQHLTEAFTNLELGAQILDGVTRFRLFAPRAQAVHVVFGQKEDSSDAHAVELKRVDASTWEAVVEGELEGWFYSYRVAGGNDDGTTHFDAHFSILDPYARACLGARGPGIVLADARTESVKRPYEPPHWHDLVILEGHVRDLTVNAPIGLSPQERTGYAGLRKWLCAKGSYLRDLGVNALELQPIQEFDNELPLDYHWGYMTVNYFSPESSYAITPLKASQVEEFRGLVNDCHEAGMAVILDVVYNHVGEPNHLLFLDKYYYFHLDQANELVNWSGCGNDLRCDTPMGRRLILDSLKHLVRTYDVDGFRFDLAELIGMEVLREIEDELKSIKPGIILIAEPWSFRGHIQDELKDSGFASWNDGFREGIADYVRGQGQQESIRYFLSGSPETSRFAAQSINYTESHDDHCWLDRITERPGQDGSDPTVLDRRRTHLMAAILFGSLGVPMLAAGQDFLRSKCGVANTYQRGDLNALDYNKRYVYSGTHQYFRDWIHFRRSDEGKALRVDGVLSEGYMQFFFCEGSSAVLALFNADGSRDIKRVVLGINPHLEFANIVVPEGLMGGLRQVADAERFDDRGLGLADIPQSGTLVSLPPISCGLWVG